MAAPSRRTLIVLAAAGVLLLGVLPYVLIVGPKRSEAEDLARDVQATRDLIAQARSQRTANRIPSETVAEILNLSTAVPSVTDTPGVLLELDRLARQSGLDLSSVSPGDPAAVGGFEVVPMRATVEGSLFEVSNFAGRLRRLVELRQGGARVRGRLFRIDQIELTEGESKFPQLTATLALGVFRLGSQTPPVAAGATPAPTATSPETQAAQATP